MQNAATRPAVLTGIKPTGRIHMGNFLGSIRPSLELLRTHRGYFFIADYHALTTLRNPRELRQATLSAAATWLAVGLDPQKAVLYRQSDVPEIFELTWVLSCLTAKGLLNRAHAYKAAVQDNLSAGREADGQINAGLYNYPILMAADILALGADRVTVGADQRQHVEIARDIAAAFNRDFGAVLKLPEALVREEVRNVPGLDGRKMSKSYGNEIPLLAGPDELRRRVMRIVTDSLPPEAPKDPERCNVFALYRHFGAEQSVARWRERYRSGGAMYNGIKEDLVRVLDRRFAPARQRYAVLMADPFRLPEILAEGAARARRQARSTLSEVRRAVGIDPP